MKIDDPTDYDYVLVQWPETQVLMDYDWFDKETSLADFNKFGSSAYFIPLKRWLEIHSTEQEQPLSQDNYNYDPDGDGYPGVN